MAQLKAQLQQYRAISRTAKQWVDCLIQPIFIMLLFVRAELEGDWPLNVLPVEEMMPYFCDSAHFNCAIWHTLSPIDAASSPGIARAVYGRRISHAPHR